MSTEEKELKVIQNKGNFKARPLNKKIFENEGKSGIPKVEKMGNTEFKEFNLKSNNFKGKA